MFPPTIISKLFEHFIIFYIQPFLATSDHQFGFKRGTGTDMCIFLFKKIISSYLQQGSPIFSVFLDAFKAGEGNCFRLRAALRPWKLTEGRIWMLNLFADRKLHYFSPKIVVIPKKKGFLLDLI